MGLRLRLRNMTRYERLHLPKIAGTTSPTPGARQGGFDTPLIKKCHLHPLSLNLSGFLLRLQLKEKGGGDFSGDVKEVMQCLPCRYTSLEYLPVLETISPL